MTLCIGKTNSERTGIATVCMSAPSELKMVFSVEMHLFLDRPKKIHNAHVGYNNFEQITQIPAFTVMS